MNTRSISRRNALRIGGAAMAGITMGRLPIRNSAMAGTLDAAAEGPAAAGRAGPRSLVCIFLAGGADSFNMFVPLDNDVAGQDHATYQSTRGSFAVPRGDLLPLHDGSFGLHPRLTGLSRVAERGDLAVVANVGPLARPTTAADVRGGRELPQFLFAHDAQQKLWQTGRSSLASSIGWGGSIQQAITVDDARGSDSLSPAFSIAGSSTWQAGVGSSYARLSSSVQIQRMLGYDESLRGWIPSSAGVADVLEVAARAAESSGNVLERAAADAVRQSIFTTTELQDATTASDENDVGMDDISGNRLGQQLRVVARLIKNRERLGMDRQVFFVRMGGWDTHRAQQQILPVLLGELDAAVASFDAALTDLGVSESVTTFTASDFGRTLTINGDGTDHGWGGHAFVFGGAVRGGRYGTFPSYSTANNSDDVGDRSGNFAGRLIPTTSVGQYGATLSRWMGMSEVQLGAAFPELARFESHDIGFLSPRPRHPSTFTT